MTDTTNHPVWDVYDQLRGARLNAKYYGHRVARLRKIAVAIDISLAITAPTSAVAGLWFWELPVGEYAWKILAAITAIVAVVKPFLGLADRIAKSEDALVGFSTLYNDLYKLVVQIKEDQGYGTAARAAFREILHRAGELKTKTVEPIPDKKLNVLCQDEVNRELPLEWFYIPGRE